MKTILLFNGQPRFVKECHAAITKFIIEPNEVTEIYAHFWQTPQGKSYKFGVLDDINDNISDFVKLYNPDKILVERQETFPEKNWVRKGHSNSGNPGYEKFANFSMQSSTVSKKRGLDFIDAFTDDPEPYVILCRTDFLPNQPIIFDKDLVGRITTLEGTKFPITDWIFGGKYWDMIKFAVSPLDQVYNNIGDATQELMHMEMIRHAKLKITTIPKYGTVYQNFQKFGEDPSAYGGEK